MDLSPYVASVRTGLHNAAALADEHTQQVADRLGSALDSTTRLTLVQALSDAASRISAELAPGSVDVRMVGADPEFVVSQPGPSPRPTLLLPESPTTETPEDAAEPDADEAVARISLRLPNSVKAKVDELADEEGISTNAWLTRSIMVAIRGRHGEPPRPPAPPLAPGFPLQQIFGPDGVLATGGGVFGPYGPFGDGGRGRDHDRERRDERRDGREGERGPRRHRGHRGSGSVQGWVR